MKKIIKIISDNKTIVLPTDTIYGISCNKQNNEVIKKIFSIKKRYYNCTFSLIVNSINKLLLWIKNSSIIKKKIKKYLKKKKKIILKKYKKSKKKKIAIRIQKNSIIKKIIKPFSAIISTSTNKNNTIPIINLKTIKETLNKNLDFCFINNKYITGIESTIISSINEKIIRKGKIKNLTIKNKKSKKIKKISLHEIYNLKFYIKLINYSYNIIYNKKFLYPYSWKYAKINKIKQINNYKKLLISINKIIKNYGNNILIIKK